MSGEEAGAVVLGSDLGARVVIVTGYDKADPRVRRLVTQGAFEVLSKPVHAADIERLMALLTRDEPGLGRIH
jgi:ActR/RegA family two-component response regulator